MATTKPHFNVPIALTSPDAVPIYNDASPFIGLPLEIRINIYRLLAPNIDVHQPLQSTRAFRHDGTPCCPSILRVNRQIYHEALREWYGHVYFSAVMGNRRQRFKFLKVDLGAEHSILDHCLSWELPSNFLVVQRLSLNIRVTRALISDLGFSPKYLQILNTCFGSSTQHALQFLHLNLQLSALMASMYRGHPEDILKPLQYLLKPLISLRLRQFTSRLEIIEFNQNLDYPEEQARLPASNQRKKDNERAALKAVIYKFLVNLKPQITIRFVET